MNDVDVAADDTERIRSALTANLVPALPRWLETRRWFADKGRGIRNVAIADVLIEAVRDDWLALATAQVEFRSGDAAQYLLPVAWTEQPGAAEPIVAAAIGSASGAFVEATDTTWFGSWLIARMTGKTSRAPERWVFAAHPGSAAAFAAVANVPATLMRAEQSNTSLRYGDALMVKLFRRLQPGPNPDEEMLRALAGVGFARVPPYAGAAWHVSDGEAYPMALAQVFVPNLGDGWTWMQQRLRKLGEGSELPTLDRGSPEWSLGRRTGELHVALSRVDQPGFAPEPVSDVAADVRRVQGAVADVVSLLQANEAGLPAWLRGSLPSIVAGLRKMSSRVEGFRAETATRRIRVHGDFHLGQTLRTPDGDWMLIDFEGEPARPVAERRQKSSALKDVAGMLRSFAYARGVADRAAGSGRSGDGRRLAAWELLARQAFLAGYRDAIRASPVPLVPMDDDAFMEALAAWELDKALYEIAYEVRNRPDWVELPVRSLLPYLDRTS